MNKKEYYEFVLEVETNNLKHSLKRLEELEPQSGTMFEVEKMRAYTLENNLKQAQRQVEEEQEKERLIEQMKFELHLKNVRTQIDATTTPTSFRQVGDAVYCEVFGPSVIIQVLDSGTIYRVEPDEKEFKQYQLYKAWYNLQNPK